MQSLRPYQVSALERIRAAFRAGKRRVLLVAPTGAGKTTIAAHMIAATVERGGRVLFLAHRSELLSQCSRRLSDHGVPHTVQQASRRVDDEAPVRVASIATCVRREPWPARLVVVDEAHRATASTYRRVLDRDPDAYVVGLTATPYRADGAPLGDLFDALVIVAQPDDLVADGYLMEPVIYAPSSPDLRGVRKARGDYATGELEGRMVPLVGSLVEHWRAHAGGAPTVAFAVTVAHSEAIVATFTAAGITAEHVDGTTPADVRAGILERLASGATSVVSNVGILTEGWDLPSLGCAVLARPTQSTGLYLQMVGRVLRPSPGKARALVLDHAGAVLAHGWPTLPREHELECGEAAAAKKRPPKKPTLCRRCFAVYASGLLCPQCGERRAPMIAVVDGDGTLRRVERAAAPAPAHAQDAYLARLQAQARSAGYKQGWIAHRFRARFGRWPT